MSLIHQILGYILLLTNIIIVKLQCSYKIEADAYIGCFLDTADRLFPFVYKNIHLPNLTNDYCYLACADEGFKYAGTQSRLHRPHPSDNHSNSSGETTTSDSGRGGSEDEVPGSTLDDSRSFEFQYPSSYSHNQYSVPKHKLNLYRSTNCDNRNTQQRLVSYNLKNVSANTISNNLSSSQPYLDISQKDMQYHSWDFLRQSAYGQYPRKDKDYFNLRPESLCTLRSRDDDDDAATTTSGSYTINPEELEDDLYHVQKDLVV